MTLQKIKNIKKSKYDGTQKIAVVLIRGLIGVSYDKKDTMKMLNLHKKHMCVLVKNTESVMGMLFKIKDYVTYGEVNEETITKLQEARGEKDVDGEFKPFYRLHPPKGGFERKGIKKPYTVGGALGYRGEDMSKLIERMI